MELDEIIQRVLRRYGLPLLLALAAAVLLAYTVAGRVAPTYTATARVQLTAAPPQSAAAADALVSQARALVSTRTAVTSALDAAGVHRDYLVFVGRDLTVDGLGGSSTIDVSVRDNNPVVAKRIVTSLVDQFVQSTNDIRLGNLPDMIKSVDDQLKQLAVQRAPIAATAQGHPRDPVAQNRLAGIDRLITDLQSTRNQLTVQSAANGFATIIDPARVPTQPQPSHLPVILLLVGLAAAIAGLLVVSLIETLRPHTSGIARISRFLGTQPLGHVVVGAHGLLLKHGMVRRLRLATMRAGEPVVVVINTGKVPGADRVIAQLDAELDGTMEVLSAWQSHAMSSTRGGNPGGNSVNGRGSGPDVADLALASVAVANGSERSGGRSAGSWNLAEAESRGKHVDPFATTSSITR